MADWLQDKKLKQLLQATIDWHHHRVIAVRDAPGFTAAMEALHRAARVPLHALDGLLFTQPLAPEGKKRVAELRAQGMPDHCIAEIVARSVAELEAARDKREADELRVLGFAPRALD